MNLNIIFETCLVRDIAHTTRDVCFHLATIYDLHSKKLEKIKLQA